MKTIFPSLFLVLILVAAIIPASSFMVKAQEEDNGNGNGEFTAQVNVGEDSVTRGNEQTITVETSDAAQVFGTITYASNFTRAFVGNTNDEGVFEHAWTIGGNAKPGTFNVKVIAISEDSSAAQASATFTVAAAEEGVVLSPEPETPAENGTVTEGNGTIIVPEEPVPVNVTEVPVNQTIPSVNETIPIPVPINTTTGNETIPVPIPVNTTTNETVTVPPLPTNETVEVPFNETETPGPIANGTIIVCITAPCGPFDNDTTTTPDEIEDEVIIVPANETVVVTPDNGTDISIPINETEVVIPTNETFNPEPTTNETEVIVAPENVTVVLTPENATEAPVEEVPIDVNETVIVVPGDIVDIAVNETADTVEPALNQSEQLPTEIPINQTTGNVTEPVAIPINGTTGNQTIEVPPIDVQIPENMTTIPVAANETAVTENETAVVKNETGSGVKDIIAQLNERVQVLEDKSTTQEETFAAVGGAIEEMGDAVSIIPGLTGEEQANIVEAVNNVKDAIAEAVS